MRFALLFTLLFTTVGAAQNLPTELSYLGYRLGMPFDDALKAPLPSYFGGSPNVPTDPSWWRCEDKAVKAGRTGDGDTGVVEVCSVHHGSRWRKDDNNFLFLTFLSRKLVEVNMTFDDSEYNGLTEAYRSKYRHLKADVGTLQYTNAFGGVFEGRQVTYLMKQPGVGDTLLRLREIADKRGESELLLVDIVRQKAWIAVVESLTRPPI